MSVDPANKKVKNSEFPTDGDNMLNVIPVSSPQETVELPAVKSTAVKPTAAKTLASQVEQSPITKANLLQRGTATARPHLRLVLACSLSLLLGGGLSFVCRSSQEPQTVEAQETPLQTTTYLASITHRNEPIQPLVPFEGLDPQIVELGRRLFHEPALSNNGRVSCASCHGMPSTEKVAAASLSSSSSNQDVPTILNVGYNVANYWDGRTDTLEEQVEHPITNAQMLGSSWERVITYLSTEPTYKRTFEQCFNGQATAERVQSALASYERSLVTPGSKLDLWLAGDEDALSSDEFGGYYLFKKYNCISCHQGAAVGGSMFQPMGVAKTYFSETPSATDLGRYNVTGREKDRFVFRVPALRNVELTPPYFHDGSVETLELAVANMLEFQCGEDVNQEDVRRIVAFLKSLTGQIPKSLTLKM